MYCRADGYSSADADAGVGAGVGDQLDAVVQKRI